MRPVRGGLLFISERAVYSHSVCALSRNALSVRVLRIWRRLQCRVECSHSYSHFEREFYLEK